MDRLHNSICSPQALAWLSRLLSERLHLSVTIELNDDNSHFIITDIDGVLFDIPRFHKDSAIDSGDIVTIGFQDTSLPHIQSLYAFKTNKEEDDSLSAFQIEDNQARFTCDPLSLIYCQLTRIEELETPVLDKHERFQAKESLGYKAGFLTVPIVDHWLQVMSATLADLRDDYSPSHPQYEVLLTHDVDVPYRYNFIHPLIFAKFVAGRLRHQEFGLLLGFIPYLLGRRGDPADTFDFIMSLSEKYGLRSEFYFIPDRTSFWMDGNYNLDQSKIKNLLKQISDRGHAIGAHFSYNTFLDKAQIKVEHDKLAHTLRDISSDLKPCGGSRMHYLRWRSWQTAHALGNAQIHYDTTLGYAEQTGFRCGTCLPYQPFDPVTLAELPLTIIPLTIMEGTIWGENYMGLTDEADFLEECYRMIKTVYDVGGICNILWHNSDLSEDWQKSLYSKVLDYAKNPA